MKIQDFCDMNEFENIMKNWAKSTGLATVAVGADGKYISGCYNFTDFCIKLTRGSQEGCRRCEQCDREGQGVYNCHAGLVDFGMPITLSDGTVLGSVIGGQVLPEDPDEDKFRRVAAELDIDPDTYINALHKVSVKTRDEIEASAKLLGDVINMFVRSSYAESHNKTILESLVTGISEADVEITAANKINKTFSDISMNQKILAINASIESAHAGAAGKGFSIVAGEVAGLAVQMEKASKEITDRLTKLNTIIKGLHKADMDLTNSMKN